MAGTGRARLGREPARQRRYEWTRTGGYDGAVTDDRIPVRTIGAVEAEVDGERILLSPKDFAYFGLIGAGAPVWDLVDGARSMDEIIAELEQSFDADTAIIRAETLDFVDALAASGLIAFTSS